MSVLTGVVTMRKPENAKEVFSFACGGFFGGHDEVKIYESANGFIGTFEHGPNFEGSQYSGKNTDIPMDREQMQKLENLLEDVGVEKWFARYFNPLVLDGTQWSLTYKSRVHGGSNLFPVGFDRIVEFLGKAFLIDAFSNTRYEEGFSAKGKPDIDFIAEYNSDFPEAGDLKSKLAESDRGGYAHKHELAYIEQASHELLSDLSVFVDRNPEYRDYTAILERCDIPLEHDAIKQKSVESLNDACIIAMMVAISRMDDFEEQPHLFEECAKDGTLNRWLIRLRDIIGADGWLVTQ